MTGDKNNTFKKPRTLPTKGVVAEAATVTVEVTIVEVHGTRLAGTSLAVIC